MRIRFIPIPITRREFPIVLVAVRSVLFLWQLFCIAAIKHRIILSVNQFVETAHFLREYRLISIMQKNLHQRRIRNRTESITEQRSFATGSRTRKPRRAGVDRGCSEKQNSSLPENPALLAGSPKTTPERIERGGRGAGGTLFIVATPIGNLEDMTIRAIRVLREVHLIAAEDTRRTRVLLDNYQIPTPMTSLHDWNESQKSALLLAKLHAGEDVAYVSDAGTPGISDPGYILVREAISHGIRVTPVPGASALIAALSVSGLPMDSFTFFGFLPSKAGKRRQFLTALRDEGKTLVFYESPHRLLSALRDIQELLGEREVVVSREITKMYEQFLRGPVGAVITELGGRVVKGEVTLIVAGRSGEALEFSDAELLHCCEKARQECGEGLSLRDIADRIARETGISRKRIYRLLLFP
jgi:16S rRNA (cytidine1402-2'-O)-methyltransferase